MTEASVKKRPLRGPHRRRAAQEAMFGVLYTLQHREQLEPESPGLAIAFHLVEFVQVRPLSEPPDYYSTARRASRGLS